jgi:penicillin amidase
MSTPRPAPVVSPNARSLPFRLAGGIILVLLLVALATAGTFYWYARSALPQTHGTVHFEGLGRRVTVERDAQGVPHLFASSMQDLLFAQGYVTAQDRLWQMDMSRRYAAGNLAEVAGPGAVAHDRRQRTLLLRETAERITAALKPQMKAYLEAYARGVNAFIESHRRNLPIEFRVMRYQPRPWRPSDTIVIGLYMSELMNLRNGSLELGREKILPKLTPEMAADLYPERSWHDHWPGQPPADQTPEEEDEDNEGPDEMDRSRAETAPRPQPWLTAPEEPRAGSNNWVVSGAHTVSGKPLLSNDTHLELEIPDIWYETELQAQTGPSGAPFDVAGFTFPGAPFVIIGHNRRIAWGFTNLEANVTDLYVETFNAAGEYQTPEGWRKPEVRHETVQVKGAAPLNFDVLVTRHGPVVSDLLPGESRKIALKWVIYDPGISLVPFDEVDAAQNWDEFRRALSHFDSPGQNAVYADVDGHIGYQATGKIPIHPPGTPLVPLPGNDDAHEWRGFVPFDKLPNVFDPESGIIATANDRVVPKKYPYVMTEDWEAPYRAERIYRVLESGKKFSAADMLELQMDIMSEFDHFCADRLVYAADLAKDASPRARTAADLLRSWDGHMTADSAAPAIETRARQELWRLLLAPKLGEDWKLYRWGMKSVALENILLHQSERWLPKQYASYDDLLTAALEAAVKPPGAPADLSQWRWGEANLLSLEHPIFGKFPVLRRWAGPGRKPQSGSALTVKAATPQHGPAERMTVDLADMSRSTMNLVTGESGQIFSPYFMDQFGAWFEGHTFVSPFGEVKGPRLVLEPN